MSGPLRRRSTIRVRLTLLYACAFFLAGAALVGLMYLFMWQALDRQTSARLGITAHVPAQASPTEQAYHQLQEDLQAQFQRDRDDTLNAMLVASLVALGVAGVGAGGLGWLLAGRALHPLQRITATARRVADRSLHERIAFDGPPDEIKDLADTFDAMLERLDSAFDSQRRFVANASHELRTPLTINRTLMEVALDRSDASEPLRQLCGTLLAVNQRHERLIDGLLTLASSEQPLTDPTPVDIADIARHAVAESLGTAENAGIDVRVDLRPARVAGDPVLLERLTRNLLDNAIRYNLPEHGRITLTTDTAGDDARLCVENTGPPVPAYEVSSLFQPFRRLAAAERFDDSTATNRGAGLGLSIVRSVARAHGGGVEASSRHGGGLIVRVRLPTWPEVDDRRPGPGLAQPDAGSRSGRRPRRLRDTAR